jgi:AAA+ ATPase superfamily predicted ATPase
MILYGRKEEMNLLRESCQAKGFRLVTLYGRRRVGKSYLLLCLKEEFANSLYFQCSDTTLKDNNVAFATMVSSSLKIPVSSEGDFIQSLRTVFAFAATQKIIVMIDEYPYLKKRIDGLDSLISKAIAEYPEANVTLILTGSFVGSMLETSSQDGALRGRNMTSLFIQPLPYEDVEKFYPDFSIEEKVLLYSVFDGIPYYATKINPRKSAYQNLLALFCSTSTEMRNEPLELLREISKIDGAHEIISALCKGKHTFTDIYQLTSYKTTAAFSYTLSLLQTMGYVNRVSILSERGKEGKGYYYYLQDAFLDFYYSFILPNLSSIGILSPEDFGAVFLKKPLQESFVPKRFEFLSREFLKERNQRKENPHLLLTLEEGVYAIPKKNHQFDIHAKSIDGDLYYECKYKKEPLSLKDIHYLEESLQDCFLPYVSLGFFSKGGYTPEAKEYLLAKKYEAYTLTDIFALA